jgi:hypothetical protein
VVAAGDRRHPEQRLAVRPPLPLRQMLLMGQRRRTLHEEHRKRRQPDVGHAITAALPRPLVRQAGATPPQRSQQPVERLHPELESHIRRLGNRDLS